MALTTGFTTLCDALVVGNAILSRSGSPADNSSRSGWRDKESGGFFSLSWNELDREIKLAQKHISTSELSFRIFHLM